MKTMEWRTEILRNEFVCLFVCFCICMRVYVCETVHKIVEFVSLPKLKYFRVTFSLARLFVPPISLGALVVMPNGSTSATKWPRDYLSMCMCVCVCVHKYEWCKCLDVFWVSLHLFIKIVFMCHFLSTFFKECLMQEHFMKWAIFNHFVIGMLEIFLST